MYNIQTLNKISQIGIDIFDKTKYTISDTIDNPDAIMVRSASMHDMKFDSNLLAIARAGAGVNNIPVDNCINEGICVFNTPGANANAVKELVIAGLLLSSRKICDAIDWAKGLKNEGDNVGKLVEKGKSQFAGPEIKGKTLGIVGLGAIGAMVANVAIYLGMDVIGYDPFLSVNAALKLSPSASFTNDIKEVYEKSDYITLHLPYSADTKDFFDAEAIAQMKDSVRILNFARAELVDCDAIIKALESGKVSCYVTDFPSAKVIGVKNVIAIPHLGASTPESEDNCAVMAAEELINYIESGNIRNSVNLPDAEMHALGLKICIIHKNIPAIISQITTILGDRKINIENMLNRSKKDYAYTMLDAQCDSLPADVVSKITSIEGVIRLRTIDCTS